MPLFFSFRYATSLHDKFHPFISAAGPPWAIIGGVVGGVVVLVIVIAVLTWCVHKKRKCRKDTKSK